MYEDVDPMEGVYTNRGEALQAAHEVEVDVYAQYAAFVRQAASEGEEWAIMELEEQGLF